MSSMSSGPEQKRRRTEEGGADKKMNGAAKKEEEEEKGFSAQDNELCHLIKSMLPDEDEYHDGGKTIAMLNEQIRQMRDLMQRQREAIRQSLVTNNPEIGSIIDEVVDRQMNELEAKLPEEIPDPNRSKLTEEGRAEIKRLVDAGASLAKVDALHIAASYYKQRDLFDLLIDEYGLGVDDPDHTSMLATPLHVAASLGNCEAIEILIAKGADKKSKNSKNRNASQEVAYELNRSPTFMREQFRQQFNVDKVKSMLR